MGSTAELYTHHVCVCWVLGACRFRVYQFIFLFSFRLPPSLFAATRVTRCSLIFTAVCIRAINEICQWANTDKRETLIHWRPKVLLDAWNRCANGCKHALSSSSSKSSGSCVMLQSYLYKLATYVQLSSSSMCC